MNGCQSQALLYTPAPHQHSLVHHGFGLWVWVRLGLLCQLLGDASQLFQQIIILLQLLQFNQQAVVISKMQILPFFPAGTAGSG
jgi:hypothetical protein